MKKVLVSVFAMAALAACAPYYDYYRGDVHYVQDGTDCIYYAGEYGNHFSSEIRSLSSGKKIVYRNMRCADLYNRDAAAMTPRADRMIIAPAATVVTTPVAAPVPVVATPVVTTTPVVSTCRKCTSCGGKMGRRTYVFTPAI